MNKLRKWIKQIFRLYDIEELQVGGHCGCCGKWVADVIVERLWAWTLCKECKNDRNA